MNWSSLFSRFARPRRRRKGAAAEPAREASSLRVESLEDRCVMAAVPVAQLPDGGEIKVLLGEPVSFDVAFANVPDATPGSNVGYGPYIDLFIDVTGHDGRANLTDPTQPTNPLFPPVQVYDGFTGVFTGGSFSATYLGAALPSVKFVTIDGEYFTHPLTGQSTKVPDWSANANDGARFHNGDVVAILEMPFGSFSDGQPPAPVHITMGTSNLADIDQKLSVTAVAGFRYGLDPEDNPGSDAPLRGAADETDVSLELWRVEKVYLGPEDETATGPNHKQRYQLNVDIAKGQTLTDLMVSDILAASMQYTGDNVETWSKATNVWVPAAAAGFEEEPNTDDTSGDQTLTYNFGAVYGNALHQVVGQDGIDFSLRFEFFVTRDYAADPSDPVLAQGQDSTFDNNTGSGSAQWVAIDNRDRPLVNPEQGVHVEIVLPPDAHVLQEHSLATQKTVQVTDLNGNVLPDGSPIIPRYTLLKYTIDFQVSDYFAFQNIYLEDMLGDGQRLYLPNGTFVPTLTVFNYYNPLTGERLASTSGAFGGTSGSAATIDLQQWFTSNAGSNPTTNPGSFGAFDVDGSAIPLFQVPDPDPMAPPGSMVDPSLGVTLMRFNISDELIARALSGKLVGGNVPDSVPGPGGGPNTDVKAQNYGAYFGGTTGQIVFYAEVMNEFSDLHLQNGNSGDRSVDQLDELTNSVPQIHGDQLDTATLTNVIGVGTDDTGTSVTLPIGHVEKTLYSVNGQIMTPGQQVTVQAGDLVTYRLTYTLPLSSFENLRITDYMPLPVLPVASNMAFDWSAAPGTIPSVANTITRGPSDTYLTVVNPGAMTDLTQPITVTTDGPSNSFTINFGTRDDIVGNGTPLGGRLNHRSSTIDLLVSVRVVDSIFVESLFLTNQVRVQEASTNAGGQILDNIVQFQVVAPNVNIYKSVVGGENVGGVVFASAGTANTGAAFTGVLNDNPSTLGNEGVAAIRDLDTDDDVFDAGDLVRFGVVMENVGRGDAYDVTFRDVLPAQFQPPATAAGLNLTVTRGDGEKLTGILVDEYLRVGTDLAGLGSIGLWDAGTSTFTGARGSIDGQVLKDGDRILVNDAGNTVANGVYEVTSVNLTDPANPTANLVRVTVAVGYAVAVLGGLHNSSFANRSYKATSTDGSGAWTPDGSIPGYYYTYTAGTGPMDPPRFTVNLTDAYTGSHNTSDANVDYGDGGLSRGASNSGPVGNRSNIVIVTYDLQLKNGASPDAPIPGQTIVNTAVLTRTAGGDGGPSTTPKSDDAPIRVKLPLIEKTLVGTGVDSDGNNAANQATIGEYVTYSVTVTIPEGKTPFAAIVDDMDLGLQFVDILDVQFSSADLTSSAPLSNGGNGVDNALALTARTTTTNDGATVRFDLGSLQNVNSNNGLPGETITITYRAVVRNIVENFDGEERNNGARLTWNAAVDGTGATRNTSTVSAGQETIPGTGAATGEPTPVFIVEPSLTTDKKVWNRTADMAGTAPDNGFRDRVAADNNDVIQYRVTISNNSDLIAHEMTLSDPLPTAYFSTALDFLRDMSLDPSVAFTFSGDIRINDVAVTTSAQLAAVFEIVSGTLKTVDGVDIDMDPDASISITLEGVFAGATGLTITNTATAEWTSLDDDVDVDGGDPDEERSGPDDDENPADTYTSSDTATIEGPPLVYKTIVATSEGSTAGNAVNGAGPGLTSVDGTIGEIVRYRLYVSIGEGISNGVQVQDFMPNGMAFLNDGTARFAYIASTNGNLSSSSLTGGPTLTGFVDANFFGNLTSGQITGEFLDGDIAIDVDGTTTTNKLFGSGQDVYFRFGDLNNKDNNDLDNEFIVIEFNALILNETGNQDTSPDLVNNFGALVDIDGPGGKGPQQIAVVQDNNHSGKREYGPPGVGDTYSSAGFSNNANVNIVEPNVSVVKNVASTSTDLGVTTVTYRITVKNDSTTANAYEVHLKDLLPASLNLQGTTSNYKWSGLPGEAGSVDDDTVNAGTDTIELTLDRLLKGQSFSFEYTTIVTPGTEYPGSVTVDNTINVDYSSLKGSTGESGPTGAPGNTPWTGTTETSSTVPGDSGDFNGERNGENGVGGLNDYVDSDTQKLGSLGNKVYFDANGDGKQALDGTEPGIGGVTVTLVFDVNNDGLFELDDATDDANGLKDSTVRVVTDANGYYLFNGLPLFYSDPVGAAHTQTPAKYQVSVPATFMDMGLTDSLDNGGTADPTHTFPIQLSGSTGDGSNIENRRDVDFGYRGDGEIGDRVYIDENNDGLQSANGKEPNLPGVDVTLTWLGKNGKLGGDDDFVLKMKTTNPSDPLSYNYLFKYLPTGSFLVEVEPGDVTPSTPGTGKGGVPSNMLLTDSVDDLTKDPLAVVPVTLSTAAPTNYKIDFGYHGITLADKSTATIGDTVWYDADGDGIQQKGVGGITEPGIAGVKVTLVFGGKDGVIGAGGDDVTFTTVTDSKGEYKFEGLPVWGAESPYRVTVETSAGPLLNAFPVQTYDKDDNKVGGNAGTPHQSDLMLSPTEVDLDQDFGYRGTAALGDFVWEDLNGNGRQDGSEPGIVGVKVDLLMAGADDTFGTADDIVVLTTSTDAGGAYKFENLAAGDYQVRFGAVPGYVRTAQNSKVAAGGTNSDAKTVPLPDPLMLDGRTGTYVLANGSVNNTVDAGYYRLQDIGDFVWYDVDGSGGPTADAGEPGIPGVVVNLYYAGLDGLFDGVDDVFAGTTTTGADGSYLFADRIPGRYRVEIDQTSLPNGVDVPTYDLDGVAAGTPSATFDLVSGTDELDADFSFTAQGSLGDRVYVDADGDGEQSTDGTEPSLPGVLVTLTWAGFDGDFDDTDDNVVLTQFTTNPADPLDSNYLFERLASGQYRVEVAAVGGTGGVPDNMTLTDSLDDEDLDPDAAPVVTLAIDEAKTDVDFGYQGTASIGDTVWFDQNADGIKDPGEPGIPNVPIQLIWGGADGKIGEGGDDVVFTTKTSADGTYTFQGLPVFGKGSPYVVTVTTPPSKYSNQTYDKDDNKDDGYLSTPHSSALVLGPTEDNEDQDFGYRGNLTLGDRVWLDLDGDGVQDWDDLNDDTIRDPGEFEPGLANVKVTLTATIDGNALTVVTFTGDDGLYDFKNLIQYNADGSLVQYTVTVDSTTLPRTSDDGVEVPLANTFDLDGSPNNQTTVAFEDGVDRDDVDFGYVGNGEIGDYVWLDVNNDGLPWADLNGNGKKDSGEADDPGIANVTITLAADVDGDGNDETFTTTTDSEGKYKFSGLPILTGTKDKSGNYIPIEYTVTVEQSTLPRIDATTPIDNTYDPDDATDPVDLNAVSLVTLSAAAPENLDQDFGFVGPGAIGDRIFLDTSSDPAGKGIWNPGEGINGVKVLLEGDFDGDGIKEKFYTVTDDDGFYEFVGLPIYDLDGEAVEYTVTVDPDATPGDPRVTLPDDVDYTADPDGTLDGVWTGNLTDGSNYDVDFGLQGKATLGDLIWIDADADHTQNNGEAGITGVKVYLEAQINGSGAPEKFIAVTDSTGYYQFVGLPTVDSKGNTIVYTVRVDQDTLPLDVANVSDPDENDEIDAGKELDPPYTGDSVSHNVTFTDGNYSNQDQDFGYRLPGVIGDTVFLDVNNSGLPDLGEGLGGVKVSLTADLNGDGLLEIFNTTTDADGKYLFEGLPFRRRSAADPSVFESIVYTVTVDPDDSFTPSNPPQSRVPGSAGSTLPSGVVNSTDPDGGFDGQSELTISKESPSDLLQDFGYRGPKAIEGSVYIDLDQDGKRGDEPGIPGILVTLTYSVDDDVAGVPGGKQKLEVVTTRTDANGNYSFSGLVPFDVFGDPAKYVVTQGEQPPQFFDGKEQLRGEVLEGTDFRSLDELDVLPVIQFRPDVFPEVVVQNNFGEYLIPELPKDPPIAFPVTVLTVPRVVDPGYYREDFLLKNPNDLDRRSILREELEYASVEGVVFSDVNNNGAFNSNERGIPGVLVKLVGPSNRQAVTDDDGRYSFDQLPVGTYSIVEIRPNGMLRGKLSVGSAGGGTSDNAFTDVGLSAGQRGMNYNFGELPPAQVKGKSFLDANRNGVQDPGEMGMPGVLVKVTGVDDRGAPVNVGAFTGWDGAFSVEDLRPGVYTVTQMPPPMFRNGPATAGPGGGTTGNGTVSGIEVSPASAPGGMVFPVQMVDTPQNAGAPLRWLWGAIEAPLRALGNQAQADAAKPEKAASRAADGKTSDLRTAADAGDLVHSVEPASSLETAAMGAFGLAGVLAVTRSTAVRRQSWEESADRYFSRIGEEN